MKIDIYMYCPACLAEGNHSSQQYWLHAWPCKGVLTLNDKGVIKCSKCRKSWKIMDTVLTCNEGRHSFAVTSQEGYAAAISTTAHFTEGGGIAWLQSVLKHL